MVVEYKRPHKLSVFNLRAGLLRADSGRMDILVHVINRITIPKDPEEKFVYNSEWLVAAALTQLIATWLRMGSSTATSSPERHSSFFRSRKRSHILSIITSQNPTLKRRRTMSLISCFAVRP